MYLEINGCSLTTVIQLYNQIMIISNLLQHFNLQKVLMKKKNSQQPWEVESSLACFFVVHFQFRII